MIWNSFSQIYWHVYYIAECGLSWWMSDDNSKRMYGLLLDIVYRCPMTLLGWDLFHSALLLLILCLLVLVIQLWLSCEDDVKCNKDFFYSSLWFCHFLSMGTYFDASSLATHILRIIFLWWKIAFYNYAIISIFILVMSSCSKDIYRYLHIIMDIKVFCPRKTQQLTTFQ